MNDRRSGHPTDAAIDAVARRLTAVDPSPNLRARVLAGMAEVRRPRPWRRWLVPVSLAGLVLAVTWPAVDDRRAAPPADVAPATVATPGAATPASAPAPAPNPGTTRRSPALAAAGVDAIDVLAGRLRVVPALAEPAPIDLEDIDPADLDVPPLVVAPLAPRALEVPALDASGGPPR